MIENKYPKYTTEDFVLDKAFLVWVLIPDKENSHFWEGFIRDHPEKNDQIRAAVLIIKSLQPVESEVPEQQLNKILQNIKAQHKTKLTHYKWGKYAAGIALLVAVGGLIWISVQTKNRFPLEAHNESIVKGKVILTNGETREFDTEQTFIKQSSTGELTINNDTITIHSEKTTLAMNQIIIPYGKRSDITLADGTHIWLNSGSQLSYPARFKADSREVYLSGEAFFDVKSDPSKPFYVTTRDIKIKVVGTSFNVSCYDEDNTTQTVLVKGRIMAGKNKLFAKSMDLFPGERLTFFKVNETLIRDKVDVKLYDSWVNGYLIFENIAITDIYRKLERYYNQPVVTAEGDEKITFSGKLDLKTNIKDVLENISFATSAKHDTDESSTIKK
jgi:ferric-dicitrate binding protein FerR (iron transport regulator)